MLSKVKLLALGATVTTAVVGAGFLVRGWAHDRRPDYHRDIAPIFARHCLECHRAEGVSPQIRLDDEKVARQRAAAIRRSVASRMMPPFAADNTGSCGTWREPRWLTTEDVSTIMQWAEQE